MSFMSVMSSLTDAAVEVAVDVSNGSIQVQIDEIDVQIAALQAERARLSNRLI